MSLLLLLLAQTTTCTTNLGVTTCRKSELTLPPPVQVYNPPMPSDMAPPPPGTTPREQANTQITGLIADNRCDDAKRVAQFYGWRDLIKAVARACP